MKHEFYIMSDEEKRSTEAFLLNNTWNLYDENFGSIGLCNICRKRKRYEKRSENPICTGHFASLDLKTYIKHPIFLSVYTRLVKELKIDTTLPLEMQRELLPDCFKGIIMKYVLVPPIGIRNTEDVEWSDNLSKLYSKLVSEVKKIYPSQSNIQTLVSNIYGTNGIMNMLSGKDGIFRKICFGKRLEASARSVIIGDPTLDIDEVYIPKCLSKDLLMECTVKDDNSTYFIVKDYPLNKDQAIPGIKALRVIENDDLVIINRQPTLSYGSILAFRAKIREDDIKAIGINPNVTRTFNADFDGDEMNIFLFPPSKDLNNCHIINFPECVQDIQDTKTAKYMFGEEEDLHKKLYMEGLTISLTDMLQNKYDGTGLEKIISSGAKGNERNKQQIMNKIGDQFFEGQYIGTIDSCYIKGLNKDEFFMHQKVAREGIVSTGVGTANTGYISRKGARSMADVVKTDKYIKDFTGIIGFL